MKKISLFLLSLLPILSGCNNDNQKSSFSPVTNSSIIVPALPFAPRSYVCYRTSAKMIIDGDLSENEWKNAPWSESFTDIEGSLKPAPLQDTRMKMLWDDDYLYIAAEIKETDIQAKLRQRDTVIFFDNDFEIFIDPDGDTHDYYEFEMNALNTVWDLLLTTPYRDYGNVINAWDIKGMTSAVKIFGTINKPGDKDDKWTVELAFPFSVLKECGGSPAAGKQWRINFSRVEWKTRIESGRYIKETDPATGKPLAEYNWIWSAQGLINMHYPELWGFLQFDDKQSGDPSADFVFNKSETIKWELRKLYYAERNFAAREKRYTANIADLAKDGYTPENASPEVILTMEGFEASLPDGSDSGRFIINTTGRVWKPEKKK